jgi:hypothetical protein
MHSTNRHGLMKRSPVFSGRSSETRSNYGKANPPVHNQDTAASLRYSLSRNFAYYEIAPRYCKVPQVHTEQREILCIRLRQDTAASLRYTQSREKLSILGECAKILQRPSGTHRAERNLAY